jgi:hypothetical protein
MVDIKGKRPGPAGFRFEGVNPALVMFQKDTFSVWLCFQAGIPVKFKIIRTNPYTGKEFVT